MGTPLEILTNWQINKIEVKLCIFRASMCNQNSVTIVHLCTNIYFKDNHVYTFKPLLNSALLILLANFSVDCVHYSGRRVIKILFGGIST